MKSKASLNVKSINSHLPTYTIIQQNNSNDGKYLKKVCAHGRMIILLNADKEKYFDYEKSTNCDTIRNVCENCQDSETLDSLDYRKIRHY